MPSDATRSERTADRAAPLLAGATAGALALALALPVADPPAEARGPAASAPAASAPAASAPDAPAASPPESAAGTPTGPSSPTPPRERPTCTLRAAAGVAAALRDGARAVEATVAALGGGRARARVARTLAGPPTAGSIALHAGPGPALPEGPGVLLLAARGDHHDVLHALPLAAADYVAAVGRAVAGPSAGRRGALLRAARAGLADADATVRSVAAQDLAALLESDPLAEADVLAALGSLDRLPAGSPAFGLVLEAVARRGGVSRPVAEALLARLERADGAALVPAVARAVRAGGASPALTQVLAEGVRAGSCEAACLLARVDGVEARRALVVDLDHDDPAVRAAALLAFAGAPRPEATAAARAVVVDGLRPTTPSAPATDLERILAARARATLRAGGTPPQRLLMAAGFYLLRAGPAEAGWLEAGLPRLEDRAVAAFLEARAREPWQGFDAAW